MSELSEQRAAALRTIALPRRTSLAGRRVRASDAQRAKVAGLGCLVCGRAPVDPAHLVPQRFGGCGEADCVVPLCRAHHRLFDRARLALAPFLDERRQAAELAHARAHVGAGRLRAALEGGGWPPPWQTNQEED
ncbi:MAG TPA: HNH endonuclease [Solirubrobacterales bacterium]|nr:HNH endonuclease [Solirubrobacterales bacterium]